MKNLNRTEIFKKYLFILALLASLVGNGFYAAELIEDEIQENKLREAHLQWGSEIGMYKISYSILDPSSEELFSEEYWVNAIADYDGDIGCFEIDEFDLPKRMKNGANNQEMLYKVIGHEVWDDIAEFIRSTPSYHSIKFKLHMYCIASSWNVTSKLPFFGDDTYISKLGEYEVAIDAENKFFREVLAAKMNARFTAVRTLFENIRFDEVDNSLRDTETPCFRILVPERDGIMEYRFYDRKRVEAWPFLLAPDEEVKYLDDDDEVF